MQPDLDSLLQRADGPRSLRMLNLPPSLDILVLAPHPDDFDAIGLTLRHLHQQGHRLHVAVLTTGASGVDDGFQGASDDGDKAALREEEQRASCRFFGLAPDRLHFLRLWGRASDTAVDNERLANWTAARPADLVFLPHGNDSNRTHRRTFEAVRDIAAAQDRHPWACLNRDAKTRGMRVDVYFEFNDENAAWKAQLLRFHSSQQARNLRTRGIGFDARVLEVNQHAAASLALAQPYAEAFELTRL